ncbi:MAG: O-antigen ligase family protein [Elusimicrobiaceae bacterium]|nr:O-antigen ligase family protein [Elusimicrobiaceae bacterium]
MNLALIAALSVFAPLAFASVEPWARALLETGMLLAAVLTVTRSRYLYPSRASTTIVAGALAVALTGLLQSASAHPVNAHAGWLPFTVWRPGTRDGIVLWCCYAAFAFAVTQAVERKIHLKIAMWSVFLTGLVVAFTGIFQKTGNEVYIYGLRKISGTGMPPFGPFINRDNAASYLVMSALCGLGLFLSGFAAYDKFAGRGKKLDFFARQAVMALMLGINIYAIIFTGSRGGIHSFAAALFIVAVLAAFKFLKAGRRTLALGGAGLLACGYLTLIHFTPDLLARNSEGFTSTVLIRLSMYKSGFVMFRDFPLWGAGLDSLIHAFPYYQNYAVVPGTVEHVHSDWLELVLTAGLAGALAFMAGLTAFMFYAVRTVMKSMSPQKTIAGICLLAAAVAFCLHACFDFPLQIPGNALTFFLILGLLGTKTFEKARADFDATRKLKTRSSRYRAALVPAAAILGILALPPGLANICRLDAAGLDPAGKAVLLEKSLLWQADPRTARSAAINYYNMAVREPEKRRFYLNKAAETYMPYLKLTPLNIPLKKTAAKTADFMASDRHDSGSKNKSRQPGRQTTVN